MNIRYKKKKGSLILESSASIVILSMVSIFIINAHIYCGRSIKTRILNEELTRNIENVKKEIQYNVSRAKIKEIFKDNKYGLMYDKDFGTQVLNKDFNELKIGNDILINIINEDDEKLSFSIEAEINVGNDNIKVNDEFEKSWWMDEI